MAEYKLKRALGVCEDLVLDASILTVDQDRGAGVKTYHTISGKTIPYSGVGCSATMISINDKIDDNALKAIAVSTVSSVDSIPTSLDDRRKFYFDTSTDTMYWVNELGEVLPLIPKATEAMALAGIDDNSYITPYTLRKVLEDACASGGLCESTTTTTETTTTVVEYQFGVHQQNPDGTLGDLKSVTTIRSGMTDTSVTTDGYISYSFDQVNRTSGVTSKWYNEAPFSVTVTAIADNVTFTVPANANEWDSGYVPSSSGIDTQFVVNG